MKKAISAQKTKMYLENPSAPALGTGTIKTASKSAPCVVTFNDVSKMKNGMPIEIFGTGWTSLDSLSWVIQNLDPTTKSAELANSDTSAETAVISADNGFAVSAFIDVCAVSYQINQNAAAQIDTTTLCDDEKTYLVGFSDPGTLTFDFFIDPTDPDYQVLVDAQKNSDERLFMIVYRNGAVRTLPVIVQSVNESGGVDQAVQGSATLKVTGPSVLSLPGGNANTQPYHLSASSLPAEGVAPCEVTLTVTEQNGAATKFAIDWGDGSKIDTITGTNSKTHTYTSAGAYSAKVTPTVNGKPGTPVLAPVVTVTANTPPYALTVVADPAEGVTPLTVTLTPTEQNGNASKFTVDWGEGSPADFNAGTAITHDYEAAGVFTPKVTPTVNATAGTQVSANDVTVSAAALEGFRR
jgi:PKD repeat protein